MPKRDISLIAVSISSTTGEITHMNTASASFGASFFLFAIKREASSIVTRRSGGSVSVCTSGAGYSGSPSSSFRR